MNNKMMQYLSGTMRQRAISLTAAGLGSWLLWAGEARSQDFELTQTFLNPNPEFSAFGESVSLFGDLALVGAFSDDTGGINSGAAHLFDTNTGTLLHTFLNPAPANNGTFGDSVSLFGDLALVGARNDSTGAPFSGAAHLFDTNTGALLHTFLNPTSANGDNFGFSVSLFGDLALVGAAFDDAGSPDSGAAYLFDTNTGALLHTFLNPTPANNDNFGTSVSLFGDLALVGALNDDAGGSDSGAAYLFDTSTGALLHTFLNPTPANDDFGASVSLFGDLALVGAFRDDTGGFESGAAYLFDTNTGALLHTFLNPTPASGDVFGISVSLFGDLALVGAAGDSTAGLRSGAAHLFDTDTGALLQTFLNPTSADFNLFGSSVSLSENGVLVGTQFGDEAYLFAAAVPEPSSAIASLLLLAGGIALRHHNRKASPQESRTA